MKINKGTNSYKRFEYWFTSIGHVQRAKKFGGAQRNLWGASIEPDNYNVSLCQYFWAANLKYWFARYGDAILGTVLGTGLLGILVLIHVIIISEGGLLALLAGYGIGIGILLFLAACAMFADWRDRRRYQEPSTAMQYVKAKKQRICPIIEFEETTDATS